MSIIYFNFSSVFGLLRQTSGSLEAKCSTMFTNKSLTFACLLFGAEQVVSSRVFSFFLAENSCMLGLKNKGMRVVRVN